MREGGREGGQPSKDVLKHAHEEAWTVNWMD